MPRKRITPEEAHEIAARASESAEQAIADQREQDRREGDTSPIDDRIAALEAAIRVRLKSGHNDTCESALIYDGDCTCGHDMSPAAARIAALEAENRWIPCAEEMPRTGQRVIFFWVNVLGHSRRSVGHWVEAGTWEVDEEWGEYDDEKGWSTAPEGWYETSWEGEEMARVTQPVTHWRALPAGPKEEGGPDA